MISHKHKLIFTHIPKTGGTSISSLFIDNCHHKNHEQTISIIKNDKFKDYYKFTVVRNPWDRLVSLYFFKIKRRKINNVEFKKFILSINNAQILMGLFPKDTNILYHVSGYLDFYLKESLNYYNHIGKFENLNDTHLILSKMYKLPPLPHLFKTKHKHYTEYYDDETREIVAEKYAKDIEYFRYKFGE